MTTALYAYAVVAPGAQVPDRPGVLPDCPVRLVEGDGLAVLASAVPRALFEDGSAEARTADPTWMADRATRHHAVVAAAAARGPALPLAFGALFSDEAVLRAWLAQQKPLLQAALPQVAEAAEWSLTLAEEPEVHRAWLLAHDSDLAVLHRQLDTAGQGAAYLLRRRIAKAEEAARNAHLASLAAELGRLVEGQARHATRLPPRADRAAGLAALLPHAALPGLQAAVAQLAGTCAGTGLSPSLSGPWPAYAYARAVTAAGEAAHG